MTEALPGTAVRPRRVAGAAGCLPLVTQGQSQGRAVTLMLLRSAPRGSGIFSDLERVVVTPTGTSSGIGAHHCQRTALPLPTQRGAKAASVSWKWLDLGLGPQASGATP